MIRVPGILALRSCAAVVFMLLQAVQANICWAQRMSDCSYYKIDPSMFAANLNGFVDDIADLVEKKRNLKTAVSQGRDITDEIYAAGLLGRVPGCIHSDAGRNVEVFGGDVTGSFGTGSIGFTVVVRALPSRHCRQLKGVSNSRNRYFQVRGEAPKKAPTPYGECLDNPVLPFVYGTLPLPNTAYVYQQIRPATLPTVKVAPNPQACGLYRQMLASKGSKQVCSYYAALLKFKSACSRKPNAPECQAAVTCQRAAWASLARVGTKSDLQSFGLNKFISLYEEVVWGDVDLALEFGSKLYVVYPDGFIDPDFANYLSGEVGLIVQALKEQLELPSGFQYFWYSNEDKEKLLQDIADIVWSELGVSTFKISFDYLPRNNQMEIGLSGLEGYYSGHPTTPSLSLKMSNMVLSEVMKRDFKIRNTHITAVLHEAFHHYQNQLVLAQSKCKDMSTADRRYLQTHIFAINKLSNYQLVNSPNGKVAKNAMQAYRGNPLEKTAREFAEDVFRRWQEK